MIHHRPLSRRILRAFGLALALLACVPCSTLLAQGGPPIFTRFNTEQASPETWQVLVELPVFLRPQAEPDAKITRNLGLNLGITFRPRNRVYFTRQYGIAQMEWEPRDTSVKHVSMTTLDVSNLLNFNIKRTAVLMVGLGLGVMDGLVRFEDGDYQTRLEPYAPIHLGVGIYTFRHWMISAKLTHAFFLGRGPVVSATRGLLGVGYNF